MGLIIPVKMITHITPNLTLYNVFSRIHTAFFAPVGRRFYVPLDKKSFVAKQNECGGGG